MGDFLKVEYYVDKDFKSLIDGFRKIYKNYQLGEKRELNFLGIKSSLIECNEKINNSGEKEKNLTEKEQVSNEENFLMNTQKNSDLQNSMDNESVEEIILSKYNTYILSAETYEKLLEKIEQMKNKKIIARKDAIESNTDTCCY